MKNIINMISKQFSFNAISGAVAVAAAIMVFAGCINPFDSPDTGKPKGGVGYFSLSIEGQDEGNSAQAKTIMPATVWDYFTQFRLEFFNTGDTANAVKTVFRSADNIGEVVELAVLPAGKTYELRVTAYVEFESEEDDLLNKAAARGSLDGIVVTVGDTAGGSIKLEPIEEDFGFFKWNITYPEGATVKMTIDPTREEGGLTQKKTWTITETPVNAEEEKGKEASVELRSGVYRVTFDLTMTDTNSGEDRYLQSSDILHIYKNMDSIFTEDFIEDYFIIKRVTGITLKTTSVQTGIGLDLLDGITFEPEYPTFTDIVWSITADNTTPLFNKVTEKLESTVTVDYEDQHGVFYSLSANNATKAAATVTVTATIEHGSGYRVPYTRDFVISVTFVEVREISLNKSVITLDDGEEEQLFPTITPPNATIKTLKWEPFQQGLFTVDDEGVITAGHPNNGEEQSETYVVVSSVSNPSASTTCTVKINRVFVTNITLSAAGYIYMTASSTTTLKAVIAPPNATDQNMTWSVVTDNANGRITVNSLTGVVTVNSAAVNNQTAIIRAVCSGGKGGNITSGDCTIWIMNQEAVSKIQSLDVNINDMKLEVGRSATLVPLIKPDDADPYEIYWISGTPEVATVDDTGTVTAIEEGKVTITATTAYGGKIAICEVEVYDPDPLKPAVTELTLSPKTLKMSAGYPEYLTATVNADAANKTLVWKSSNELVATVVDGQVIPVMPGNPGFTTITVSTEDSGFTDFCVVQVAITEVERVELNTVAVMLSAAAGAGHTVTLTATVYPFNATNRTVKWEIEGSSSVVSIVPNNLTCAVTYSGGGTGTAVVRVTSLDTEIDPTNGKFYKRCTVNPRTGSPAVTDLKLTTNEIRIAVGERIALQPVTWPLDGGAQYQNTRSWFSADDEAVSVSASGVLEGLEVRDTPVRIIGMAVDGGFQDYVDVTVYSGSMAKETRLNIEELRLQSYNMGTITINTNFNSSNAGVGRAAALIATVLNANGTPSANQRVIWRSRSSSLLVFENGLVAPVSNAPAGTTGVISATSVEGGNVALCTVTVVSNSNSAIVITGVRLSAERLNLELGDTPTLTAYGMPEIYAAYEEYYHGIRWSSSNPAAASIDLNGKITANAVGTATITVTTVDAGHQLNCVVTVRPPDSAPKVEKRIKLNINEMTLGLSRSTGNMHPLRPVLFKDGQGENVAANGIYWSSSDTTVAAPYQGNTYYAGVVNSTSKSGKARIMATAIDGGYTDVCEITVGNVGTPVSSLVVNNAGGTNIMNIMKYLTLNMRFNPPTGEVNTGMFTPIITPATATNKDVVWFNSNPEVARINEATGEITAQAVGRTIVTATTVSNGYSGTVEVIVIPGGTGNQAPSTGVPVSGITIEIDESRLIGGVMYVYDTAKFKVTVTPENAANKEIIWSHADYMPSHFELDNEAGLIKGNRRVGQIVLIGTTVDGGKTAVRYINILGGMRHIPHADSFDGKGFYMSIYEFTMEASAWVRDATFTNSRPNGESGPVPEITSYFQALLLCNQMSVKDGLTPAYEIPDTTNAWSATTWTNYTTDTTRWGNTPTGSNSNTNHENRWRQVRVVAGSTGYRLPTPEQWEFAYRGGTTTIYYWGDNFDNIAAYGWYYGNSYSVNYAGTQYVYQPHTVGLKQPNAYGLYDMAGNVSEYVYGFRPTSTTTSAWTRGGGYSSNVWYLAAGNENVYYSTIVPYAYNKNVYFTGSSLSGSMTNENGGFRVIRPALDR